MSITTKIEWCDSTCNPAPYCTGCELYPKHCYAARMVNSFGSRELDGREWNQVPNFGGTKQ